RKYKKCCLSRHEAERSANRGAHPLHDLDMRLVRALSEFAARRHGAAWLGARADFADEEATLQLAIPWALYHRRSDGATVLERYLEERHRRLGADERAWLEAQRAARLSVWEVTGVEPGARLALRDLLSGERREVRETTASRTLVRRDAVLGRVVDGGGASLICGLYPRSLPPLEAAEVVRRAQARLRRKGAVPPERLRDERFGRALIRDWEEAVAAREARSRAPAELSNTDGDPFLLTTDHFEIAPGARAAIEARIAALPGVEPPSPDEGEATYVFLRAGNRMHRSWETTVVGQVRVSDRELRAETNSHERADALRARLEAACGERIRHRAREHADPLSDRAARAQGGPGPEPPPPEAAQLLLEFQQRHYADWLDQPVPALGGRTPREAARTAEGRAAVDVLLKEMENREQRSPSAGATFDFSALRRELCLDDGGEG
ncbi:MAG TPA: antitoxin Xre/MbcA/ParS toxin-binding domain-containing protein, partial [Myxococcota bacterium]|nr:antitoxin Xre/MbcA/ParS toxin-binding domain-containing protein [Myxococcota bacterium]